MLVVYCMCVFSCSGDHRDLHVLTHSFPTLRPSDLTHASSGKPYAPPRRPHQQPPQDHCPSRALPKNVVSHDATDPADQPSSTSKIRCCCSHALNSPGQQLPGRRGTGQVRGASVDASTCSRVTPGASSTTVNEAVATSKTPRLVITRCTTARPVSGSEQETISLAPPSRVVWSISTITLRAPWTRSIAPPMPLTILPGTIQLARSPVTETCMPPRTATSRCAPRIIAKLMGESKKAAPGLVVTVSLPALIRSGSRSST